MFDIHNVKAYFDVVPTRKQPGEVVDAAAMRALAHPLRWRLIEILTTESPATATRCAELTGESQATCSFHLRQLARYGFVAEAPSQSKRERPWRLIATTQSWSTRQPDPARARAAAELNRVFVTREAERMNAWVRTAHTYPDEWQEAALMQGTLSWMTPAELADVRAKIGAVLRPYVDRDKRADGSAPVRILAVGYPVDHPIDGG